MFTQQHFEKTAEVLRRNQPDPTRQGAFTYTMWRQIVEDFADTYTAMNPRFNRSKFMRAAGVTVLG